MSDNSKPWVIGRAETWGYQVPSQSGWYWWQERDWEAPIVVCVFHSTCGRMGWFNHSEDEWYGDARSPIGRWSAIPEPPSHEAWPVALMD